MTARTVRGLASGVCVVGIAGMIASAVAGSTGAALTLGLLTATAVLCSIVATTVTGSRPVPVRRADPARVESLVRRLVESGADEADVRALVAQAKRLHRSADLGSSADPDVPI
ncbi:MAG TPA: hypothetical protein VK988_16310 [Acidimicrobiales bacterium]|nr:hypothetical protein [Acidimicrobiales bacterium]